MFVLTPKLPPVEISPQGILTFGILMLDHYGLTGLKSDFDYASKYIETVSAHYSHVLTDVPHSMKVASYIQW